MQCQPCYHQGLVHCTLRKPLIWLWQLVFLLSNFYQAAFYYGMLTRQYNIYTGCILYNQCGVGLVCSTWKSKESATVCALVAPIVLSRVMLSMHLSVRWTINPVGHYDMCKLLVQYTVEPPRWNDTLKYMWLKQGTRDTMGPTILSLVERSSLSRPYLGGQIIH
jgi:hypothetical protein